jgi:hypothetical protein
MVLLQFTVSPKMALPSLSILSVVSEIPCLKFCSPGKSTDIQDSRQYGCQNQGKNI